jgi:hypothetical protein
VLRLFSDSLKTLSAAKIALPIRIPSTSSYELLFAVRFFTFCGAFPSKVLRSFPFVPKISIESTDFILAANFIGLVGFVYVFNTELFSLSALSLIGIRMFNSGV